jgi:protein dithiol oxidoreductase (disulfide-forming)
MKRLTTLLLNSIAALALVGSTAALAQPALQEGRDYTVIPQQPTQDASKIEVAEFFQYACVHCFNLAPMTTEWEKKLPKDVVMRRMPISFDPSLAQHVRMYYALESLNRLSDLHMRAFNAVHLDKRFLRTPEEQADYFSKFNVDKAKYIELFNSFSVQSKARAAQQALANYKIEGTPALVVNGRYVAMAGQAGGQAALLRTVDALIAKVRAERGGTKPAETNSSTKPAAKG